MFSLEAKIANNSIHCKIETEACADDQFYYYVMKDGAIVHRSEWTSENELVHAIEEPGNYYIQAHLKRDGINTFKRSGSLFFNTASCAEELKLKWDSEELPEILEPSLYTLKKPFSTFLVHHRASKSNSDELQVQNISASLKKSCDIEHGDKLFTLYQFSESQNNNNILLYSGTAICQSRFIFGDDDVNEELSAEDFISAIGNFTIIGKSEDRVTLHTDYFGFSKVFYYTDGNNSYISNSYHLLLKAIKSSGTALNLDYDIALSKLNFVGLQPFYQNFSRRMDMAGIICLPIDKLIYFDNKGMHIGHKVICNTLYDEREVTHDEYVELIDRAKQEIISNLDIIAKHPKFDRIIVDVSGGMDSRLVFSAVTHLPEHRDKIVINSQDTRGAPDELNVALTINSKYEYSYDDTAETIVMPPPQELYENISSYYMGTYYSFNYSNLKTERPGTIRITGFGGEIVARPYFSRLHLNTELDTYEVGDFADRYFEKFGYLSLFGTNSELHSSTKNIFSAELNQLPGDGAIEKFDIHYLYYRNGLHCSDSLRADTSGPEFAILQSKSAFALKKRCFNKHKSVKLQLDLMNALNPFLAQYPYESEMDNNAKETLQPELIPIPQYLSNLKLKTEVNKDEWDAAQKLKRETRKVQCEDYERYKIQFNELLESRLNNIVAALKLICGQDDHLIDTFATPVYYFAKNNFKGQASGTHFQNLYTKLMSIAQQLKIAE